MIIGLILLTLFGGIYATVALVPNWGAEWLPLVVGFGLTVALFRQSGSYLEVLRTMPVVEAVKTAEWPAGCTETQYRDHLIDHLERTVGVRAQPERPLPSGSRIDLWLLHDGCEYFISLKRFVARSANQQRLVIQGEMEDILTDLQNRKVDSFHLVVVMGVQADERRALHHAHRLEEHLIRRVYAVCHCFPSFLESEIRTDPTPTLLALRKLG